MALFDRLDPLAEANQSLIGRPSLRRSLASLDGDQTSAVVSNLAGSVDPTRFKQQYRDQLQDSIANTQQASRLNRYDALNAARADPRLSISQRSAIDSQLRELPNPNSVEGRFDPRNPNSVAYRQFGSLYRGV